MVTIASWEGGQPKWYSIENVSLPEGIFPLIFRGESSNLAAGRLLGDIPKILDSCAIRSINSLYFHIIGDVILPKSVGVYRAPWNKDSLWKVGFFPSPRTKELIDPGSNDIPKGIPIGVEFAEFAKGWGLEFQTTNLSLGGASQVFLQIVT